VKRAGGLFPTICDRATLGLAAWRASAGKRDHAEVHGFFDRFDGELAAIGGALTAGAFQFDGYRSFPIRDPKSRMIRAPSFRDRVVHHAIVAVAGKVFERGALPTSFACRAGRGQDAALRAARRAAASCEWFLKVDVRKYYDSVSHDLLNRALERRFRERRLLGLFERLLASYHTAPGCGLPIGALTSQYLGNFFLDTVDRHLVEVCRPSAHLRYMDDFLLCGNRVALDRCRAAIRDRLAALGLEANGADIVNRCAVGIPWLGFVVYPDRLRLNRLGRRRLRRRLRSLERGWRRGTIDDPALQARARALFAHAARGDDIAWRRVVAASGGSRLPGEVQGPQSRDPRRVVEQHRQEVPVGLPQQEQAG